jgi:hypothetical protein
MNVRKKINKLSSSNLQLNVRGRDTEIIVSVSSRKKVVPINLKNLFLEVCTAKRAICLSFQPFDSAGQVEEVLHVTFKGNDYVTWLNEALQTNGAVFMS